MFKSVINSAQDVVEIREVPEPQWTEPPKENEPPEYLVELNFSHDEVISTYLRNVNALQKVLDSTIAEIAAGSNADPEQITALKNAIGGTQETCKRAQNRTSPKDYSPFAR